MSITDELRKWIGTISWLDDSVSSAHKNVLAIADRIDAEHGKAVMSARNDALYHANDESMAELGWARLPKDADGVPIRAGDAMDGYGKTIEVVELRYGHGGWVIVSRDGNGYTDTFAFTHHHTPTVEDVLRECIANVCRSNAQLYEQGCSPLTMEDIDSEPDEYIAEYAAKLRLAGGAE